MVGVEHSEQMVKRVVPCWKGGRKELESIEESLRSPGLLVYHSKELLLPCCLCILIKHRNKVALVCWHFYKWRIGGAFANGNVVGRAPAKSDIELLLSPRHWQISMMPESWGLFVLYSGCKMKTLV